MRTAMKGSIVRPLRLVDSQHYQCKRCGIIKGRNGAASRRRQQEFCQDCLDVIDPSRRSVNSKAGAATHAARVAKASQPQYCQPECVGVCKVACNG